MTALQRVQHIENAKTRELLARMLARGDLKQMPTPDESHPSPREVIMCMAPSHEGLWVPAYRHWDSRDSKTALEIAIGAITTMARSPNPAPHFGGAVDTLKKFGVRRCTTKQKWDFLVGLCVVGLAERISLDRNPT